MLSVEIGIPHHSKIGAEKINEVVLTTRSAKMVARVHSVIFAIVF